VPEEGVVFTGDNVFHKCRTGCRNATLGMAGALDEHRGARRRDDRARPRRAVRQGLSAASRRRSSRTGSGFIETYVDRGVEPDEILKETIRSPRQDPYPIGQRLFMLDERLTGLIVRNLHRRIRERKEADGGA
jgi:hypothetical protein